MKQRYQFLKLYYIQTKKLSILILLYLCISLLTLAQPEALRQATNAISEKSIEKLYMAIVFATICAVLFMLLGLIRDIFTQKTQNYYEKSLGTKMLTTLTRTKMSQLNKKRFGDVSIDIIQNVRLYIDSMLREVSNKSAGYCSLALTFIYMCVIQWQLALCVLIYNLIIRFLAIFIERKIKRNSEEVIDTMKKSGNELNALLRNMMVIRIYSNKDFFLNRFKQREKAIQQTSWKNFAWSNGFQDFIWAFSKMAEFIIVYGVGAWLISIGKSDISILLTFVFANDLFTIGINKVSEYIQAKAEAGAYEQSLKKVLDEKEQENETGELRYETAPIIQFEHVDFAYNGKQVLKDVSFTIYSGEKILLKGPNGQGKSTILKLISGLYRPQKGKIYLENVDISKISIDSLLKGYGYIPQNCHLLEGSVLENLALSSNVDIGKANEVLNSLNLSHCTIIDPQNISMGEKQRLNIGRTLYRGKVPLLLCDEIFSNVDKENREIVLEALNRQYSDSTLIMITHEDILYEFDRIFVIQNGILKEEVS